MCACVRFYLDNCILSEHTLVCKLVEVQGVSHGALPLAETCLRSRRAHLQECVGSSGINLHDPVH